ncbi:hypothetical protein ACJRO7_005910 [Eucalyptus globulus]|uniref:Uncharacterized protein n=1 Tax=Eucalyptus globulus TaxID=34317 RepID=A0ABD3J984_EUCGL
MGRWTDCVAIGEEMGSGAMRERQTKRGVHSVEGVNNGVSLRGELTGEAASSIATGCVAAAARERSWDGFGLCWEDIEMWMVAE